MTRKGTHSVGLKCWIVLVLSLAASTTIAPAHADVRLWLVAEPLKGMPPCEEFYDKWEVPGAPPAMMAMVGLGREVFAAKACLDKGDVATACKHWQGLLAVMDKIGPPLDESRGDVEALMAEHKCETAAASEPGAAPTSTPGSEQTPAESAPASKPAPDAEATPPPPASGAPAESPAAEK